MLKLIGLIAVIIGGVLLRAWVLATLWGWFVVAHFGIKPITMPVAFGLSVIVGMFQYAREDPEDNRRTESEKVTRAIGFAIVAPLFALGLGALATVWMP